MSTRRPNVKTKKQKPAPPKPPPPKLVPVKIRQRADVATANLLEALDKFAEPYGVMVGQWSGGASPAMELLSVNGQLESMFSCMKALSKKFDKIKGDEAKGVLAISWGIGVGFPVGKVLSADPAAATKLALAVAD